MLTVKTISHRDSYMKKLFVSVGLIAAGTAGLQAAYAPDMGPMTASKVWAATGTLRGFYDDNYQTSSDANGSFGFEVSPQLSFNLALQQTELGARYTFGAYYYEERDHLGQDPWDYTHQFDLWLDHAFTERWQARATDSFVVGQEPELVDPGTSLTTRTEGNNIRNTAHLSLNTVWTRLFSTQLGYGNTFYDYENSGTTEATLATEGASLAGTMNRMEQSVSLDLQWIVAPETLFFVGGMFGWVDYTGDEPIAQNPNTLQFYNSDSRNSRSYFAYVGLERSMLSNLSFNGRVGFQYTDNFNDPSGNDTSLNPYADLSLIYTYLPGSYAQFGFTQTQNATDQTDVNSSGHIAMFTDSSTVYASLNHKITPKLMGTAIARWQHSIYSGGPYDGDADDYFNLGLNFSYSFNPHFSAEAGYNFDNLQSDVPGNDYTRNRVYLGVSATY
jgi:hypothetical protein